MSRIVELGRSILALLNPVTGDRATGTLTVTATGAAVTLKPSKWLSPVIDGTLRRDILVKIAPNPDTSDHTWVVNSSGTPVSVVSNIGGIRHNLALGTTLRFEEQVQEGIEPEATLATAMSGGTEPAEHELQGVTMFESAGLPLDLNLFRTTIGGGKMPIAVLVWTGSELADGNTQSRLDLGGARVGRAVSLYAEHFTLYIFSSRLDSDPKRREEGMFLLDECAALMSGRRSIDGACFSSPAGIQLLERFRHVEPGPDFSSLYGYGIRITATQAIRQRDDREYNDWLRANIVLDTCETANDPKKISVGDVDVLMPQRGFDDGFDDGFA